MENPREEARVLKPRVPVTEPVPDAGFVLPAVCVCACVCACALALARAQEAVDSV